MKQCINKYLNYVWINLTSACNNKCLYCYDATNTNSYIHIDTFKQIVALIRPLRVSNLILIGGEPTRHPQIAEILSLCGDVAHHVSIVTNGSSFASSDFCRAVPLDPIDKMLFSIISHKDVEHDRITQRVGSHKELLEGYRNIRALAPSIRTIPITTITSENLEQLSDILDFTASIGFNNAIYNVCTPSIVSDSLCVDPSSLAHYIVKLYRYSISIGIPIQIATSLPRCIFDSDAFLEMKNRNAVIACSCQVFWNTGLHFLSNGDITPCTHLFQDILINPLKNEMTSDDLLIWLNSPSGAKARKRYWNYPSQACSSCAEWGDCTGGCPILWTKYDSNHYLKPM